MEFYCEKQNITGTFTEFFGELISLIRNYSMVNRMKDAF